MPSKSGHPFVIFLVNKPKLSLCIGLVFVLLFSVGSHRLTSNFSYRIWFDEGNELLQTFDKFERNFGSDEVAVIVVNSPSGVFDKDSAQLITELTEEIWKAPGIIRVDSLSNFNWVRGEDDEIIVEPLIPDDQELTNELLDQREHIALNHPSVKGYLVSADGKNALVYARLKPAIDEAPDYDLVVNGIRKAIKKYEGHTDHKFYQTGNAHLTLAFSEISQEDMKVLVPLVFLMTFIFLFLTFKKAGGVLLPVTVVLITIAMTVGFIGWADIAISTLTGIVPQFMVAIAIAVVVHVLVSFYQLMGLGMDKKEAIIIAYSKNLRPTILTSLSTAIGFFSYSTSAIPQISEMGIMAGAGTLFSWVVSYLIIAPLLMFIPIKAGKKEKSTIEKFGEPSPRAIGIAEIIYKFRKSIIALFTTICIIAIGLASQIEVNSDPFEYFDPSYSLSIANHFMEDNVGGSTGIEIVIDSGSPEGIKDPGFLKKVDQFQQWLDQFPFITKTASIIDILKDMNKNLHEGNPKAYTIANDRKEIAEQLFLYTMNLPQGMDLNDRMTLQNDSIRLTAMWDLHKSKLALMYIDEFEKKAKSLGLNATVTGKGRLYPNNNHSIVNSFVVSISMALFLVSLLLIFGLKSLKIGLLSIIPNTIPLVMGASLLPLFGIYLDIGTVIVGSVCLGIAVDDTIHFLSTYRTLNKRGYSPKDAVARVYTYTAPALITTTLVLVAAFATFSIAVFVPNQNFGKFVAIILSIALIADLTFLPALVMTIKTFDERPET